MSSSNCCFLTCIQISQESVRWSGIPISKSFPQFVVIHTVKSFSIVNEADVLLEFSCFFYDPNMPKDDAVKVLHSVCQQIWKTQQWPQDWKRSVFIPIPKKGNAEECSNYQTIALVSHTSKVMLNILQARLLQQCVSRELSDVQARFRKGKGISAHVFC